VRGAANVYLRVIARPFAAIGALVMLAACGGGGGPAALTYVSLPPPPPASLGVNPLEPSGQAGFLSGIVPTAATAATMGLVSVDFPVDSSVAGTVLINAKAGAASSVARTASGERSAAAAAIPRSAETYPRGRAVRAASAPPPVGTHQTFFVGATASRGGPVVSYTAYPFTLVSTSAHVAVWVHDASLATFAAASSTFANDAEVAYGADTAAIGPAVYTDGAPGRTTNVPYCDSAGNPTGSGPRYAPPFAYVNVLVVDPGTVGQTTGSEFVPDDTHAQANFNCDTGAVRRHSNEGGFLVIAIAPVANVHYAVQQSVAHQLAHLIQFVDQAIVLGRENPPPAAIREGLADLARDIALGSADIGNVAGDPAQFLAHPQDYSILAMTGANGPSSSGNYGGAYLLMRYVADSYGYGFIKSYVQNDPLTGTKASYDALAAAAGATSFDLLFRDFGAALAASAGGLPPQAPYTFTSLQFGHTYQNVQTNGSAAATVTVPPVGVAGTTTFAANQPFAIYPGGVTVLAIANPVSKEQLYVTDATKALGIAGVIASR
jgi:hypothetical protein